MVDTLKILQYLRFFDKYLLKLKTKTKKQNQNKNIVLQGLKPGIP